MCGVACSRMRTQTRRSLLTNVSMLRQALAHKRNQTLSCFPVVLLLTVEIMQKPDLHHKPGCFCFLEYFTHAETNKQYLADEGIHKHTTSDARSSMCKRKIVVLSQMLTFAYKGFWSAKGDGVRDDIIDSDCVFLLSSCSHPSQTHYSFLIGLLSFAQAAFSWTSGRVTFNVYV